MEINSFSIIGGTVMFGSHMLVDFPSHDLACEFVSQELPDDEIEGLDPESCDEFIRGEIRDEILEAIAAGRCTPCYGLYSCGLSIVNIAELTTLDQLFAALWDGTQELHEDLPTFGGEHPEPDRGGIWSWDETRVIVGTSKYDLRIVTREELDTPNQIGTIDGAAILAHDGSREDGWCVECGRHIDPVGTAGVFESLPHYSTHPESDGGGWDGSCPYCGAPASRVGVRAE